MPKWLGKLGTILFFVVLCLLILTITGCGSSSAESQGSQEAPAASESTESDAAADESASDAASGTASESTASAALPALQVAGTQLVDDTGAPVQLRGISTHGLAWFPQYVNSVLFRELHEDWGANVVRLALYTQEYGGWCEGGERQGLWQLLEDGIDYATDAGMYVIVDWHILSDGDPNTNLGDAKVFFEDVSKAYADRTNVLYEICNEPNGATTWADVKRYAEAIIPLIRKNDPDAVVIVGTPTWSQDVDVAAGDPLDFDNVMYSLHFYAASHGADIRAKAQSALDAGLPLFVSEFGICDASGNGAIDEAAAQEWMDFLNAHGVSYVMWSLSNKDESSAALLPSCDKVFGFEDADLSQAGTWLRTQLAS